MTVLRCTAMPLKRLKQPARPPEPQANPLGEWYADIDFWRRQPFVVLPNGRSQTKQDGVVKRRARRVTRLDAVRAAACAGGGCARPGRWR